MIHLGKLDWVHSADSQLKPPASGAVLFLEKLFWPSCTEYVSVLKPQFIFDVQRLDRLNTNSTIMARDGLVPLAWFFCRFRNPGNFKGKILIDTRWTGIVPDGWRKLVGTYDTFGETKNRNRAIGGIETLYLSGILSPYYISNQKLTTLKTLIKKIKIGNRKLEVKCFLPPQRIALDNSDIVHYQQDALKRILGIVGTDCHILSNSEFFQGSSLTNSGFLNLNSRTLVSDCSLQRKMISRGAVDFERTDPSEYVFEDIVEIAPRVFAGICWDWYKKMGPSKSVLLKFAERANRYGIAVQAKADAAFPWSRWFAEVVTKEFSELSNIQKGL